MADYKISLGVQLQTDDIISQINEAERKVDPITIKVDAETKELTKSIQDALKTLSGGAKNALTLDTSKFEGSIADIKSAVVDLKRVLGSLDDSANMKSLLASVNQIANAIGKVTDESETLAKSLSALSKKDFNFNFGFNMGKSASQISSEQGDIKRSAISQLKQQAKAIEDYLDSYYKVSQQGEGVVKLTQGTNAFSAFWELSPNIGNTKISLKQQVATYKQYIDLMREAARIKGVDLSSITSGFSRSTDDIVRETSSATNGVEQLTQSFKNLFGSSVDGEKLSAQLDSIVTDLNEIKTALQGLSSGASLDGLTATFDRLSESIETLVKNAVLVKQTLGDGLDGMGATVDSGSTERAIQDQKELAQAAAQTANVVAQSEERKQQAFRETADAYEKISRDTSLTRDAAPGDDFKKSFESSNQAAQEAQRHFQELLADEKAVVSVTEQFDDNNALQSFTVNIKRATGEVETLRYAMDKLNDEGDEGFVYQGGSASDGRVEKQLEARIKKANELQIKLDKIKSGYDDMGAAKPIKDSDHIKSLDVQYRKVEKAITAVRDADDSTFSSMIANAEKQRAVLESMVREYRNAENVATSLRSKDISTVKDTYASKLDVLVSKMKTSGVYTDGFEKGAENLRSVLSNSTDASGLVKFLNGLDKLEAGYKRADAAAKEFNRSQKVGINVSGLESKIADLQRISPEIDKFETEIDGAKVSVKSLIDDLQQVKTQGDFSTVNARFKAFKEAASAAGIAVTETAQKVKSINDIKIKISDTGFNGFEQEVLRARNAAEELEGVYPDLESALKRLDAAMADVYSADEAGDVKKLVAANEEYEAALKQVYSQLKLNQQAEQKAYKAELLNQKKAALSSEMETWLKENTRAAKDFGDEIRRLQASLNGLDDKGVKLVGQQFKAVTKQAQAMGKTGLTTFDRLKSKVKEYTAYLSAAELFMYAEQALRSMFEQVKLIDSAMTELKKVTDETDASYNQFLGNAASKAKELGTTIDGLVSSTADFARLGYDFADAQGLAEVANIYAVVGDEIDGVEGATESLISTMAAFKSEMNGMSNTDFAMSIIDVFNELGNNFAISSGGIGEALERSASSLAAANNSLHESAALVTAANTVVQSPEQVGNAFKTISMRIRGAKTELEDAGLETEGMVESTAKLRQEILALSGVDIMENANEFKSTYKIMDELAQKWESLTDIQQAKCLPDNVEIH